MGMTHQQFSYLSEMGIALWQHKENSKENATKQSEDNPSLLLSITLEQLTTTQLFKDIIVHLGFDASELEVKNNILKIGLFTWCFCTDETLLFENNLLKTPPLSELSKNKTNKVTLMKIFEQHNLFNVSE